MENSHFVNFFGGTPLIRAVDFLIENKLFDYTKTEIADGAEISRMSLYKIWNAISTYGIVKPTRKIGRATLYRLDDSNPTVQKLIELDFRLSTEFAEGLAKKQQLSAAYGKHKVPQTVI